jgi:hypothetical protein
MRGGRSAEYTYEPIFLLIILTATVLRFYDYGSLPFTHDEFSALFRTEFDNFSDLVYYGVKTGDTHPAGVQIFLYYWVIFFGSTTWVVKLPFTLAGIGSIYFLHKKSKLWFNDTAALVIAVFYCSILYTVMYTQIGSPYGTGMLLSTAMMYFWSQLIFNFKSKTKRNIILYVLFSAACAYNYHFNLLFVALLGITGFFLVPNKRKLIYSVIGLSIFALYLPHLSIFFYQLQQGGIEGWLRKPYETFFPDYPFYLHNYSVISVAVTILIITWSIFKSNFQVKKIIIAAILGLTPFLIGYYYSVHVNDVLRQSVLIFNFLFLLFLIFGNIKKLSPKITFLLVVVILTANSCSLIFTRNHYNVFYSSRYEHVVADALNAENLHKDVLAIIDSEKKITEYYFEKHGTPKNYVWFDSVNSPKKLLQLIAHQKPDTKIQLGCLSANKGTTVPLINSLFHNKLIQNNYHGGTTYLFSKGLRNLKEHIHVPKFDDNNFTHWNGINAERIQANGWSSSGKKAYYIDSLSEWTPHFTIPLNEFLQHGNQFIDAQATIKPSCQIEGTLLVATLSQKEKEIYWGASDMGDFEITKNDSLIVMHATKLSYIITDYNNLWTS